MTVVQILIGRTRSTMRKAAVLLAATQIVLGSAPFAETGSRSAGAHVEAAGVQLHHAHTEETCIACAAFKILDGAAPSDRSCLAAAGASAVAIAAGDDFNPRLAHGPPRSRAPPSTILG